MTATADSDCALVSVLVASYNHAAYIEACLDSLIEDGYDNLELVLLDDGSSDSSYEIAESWVARNSKRLAGGARLSRQPNRGLVPTLNSLIRAARGQYFALLASDDCLLAGGIAARVDYLKERPRYQAVFGDAVAIDPDGRRRADSVLDYSGVSRTALRCDRTRGLEIIIKWRIPGPVYLARREVIEHIGFYDGQFSFEDRDYYLRLIAARTLGYVDAPVAACRRDWVGNRERYLNLKADYQLVELHALPRIDGVERMALAALTQRHRAPPSLRAEPLAWCKYSFLGSFLRRMHQLNRVLAWLLGGSQNYTGQPERFG